MLREILMKKRLVLEMVNVLEMVMEMVKKW